MKHPQILGGSIAGEVVQLGPGIKNLKLGDKVCSLVNSNVMRNRVDNELNRSLVLDGGNRKRKLIRNLSRFRSSCSEKSPKTTPSNKQ